MKQISEWIFVVIALVIMFITFFSPVLFMILLSEPFYLFLFIITPGITFGEYIVFMFLFEFLFK